MNCEQTAAVLAAIDKVLETGRSEDAVAALRATEMAPEHARRAGLEKLDAHLRANPDRREIAAAHLIIAMRRAGV